MHLLSWATWPVLIGMGLVAARFAIGHGFEPGLVSTAVVWAAAAVVILVQRILPYESTWQRWRPDAGGDLLHAGLSTWAGSALAEAGSRGLIVSLFAFESHSGPLSAAPWWAQLVVGLLACDFVAYWLHRASHIWPPLWRLHAMHHSSERLHALSSARTHPLYVALTHGLQALPLLALGAGPELLALHAVFTGVNGLVQHSNADLRFGVLNRLFSTTTLHRWHHSVLIDESQHNFGNNLSIWDRVFGTWYLPADRRPVAVGLGSPYPAGWWSQIRAPFRSVRYLAAYSRERQAQLGGTILGRNQSGE